MSFKICYDAQVLQGNLVSPEESLSNTQGKEKKNGEKTQNRGGSRDYDLYIDVLYFSSTPSIFFFHQGITVYSSGQKTDGAQVSYTQ